MTHKIQRARIGAFILAAFLFGGPALASNAAGPIRQVKFDIPAQPLISALYQFSTQAKVQVVTKSADVSGATTKGVVGLRSIGDGVGELLKETGFSYEVVDDTTIAITLARGKAAALENGSSSGLLRLAQAGAAQGAKQTEPEVPENDTKGIPEILVKGARTLNMDVRRSRDDIQPYTIFDRKTLERSGATNVEQFLKNRLTMNSQANTASQTVDAQGSVSRVDLRGLGTNQTLILIDGRRVAGGSLNSIQIQTDLNSIPVAAVERVEVLPTTASGIYGGGATGGVLNVVLRRDYVGAEANMTFEDTVEGSAPVRRIDLSGGMSLEGGKTNVLFMASYSDTEALVAGNRRFIQDGIAHILANQPSYFSSLTSPPLGYTTNIRSVNGSPLFGPGTPNFTSVPIGYAGNGGLPAFQPNAGVYNLDLANSAQSGGAGWLLANGPVVKSVMTTVRREFSDSVSAFLEAAAGNNTGDAPVNLISSVFTVAASAPNNPFGQDVRVNVPFPAGDGSVAATSYDRRVAGGAIVRLPRGWQAGADYTWSRMRNEYSFPGNLSSATAAAVLNGSLNVLRDTNLYPVDFSQYVAQGSSATPAAVTMQDVALRLAGPAFTLPGGDLTISSLLEYREELFGDGYQFTSVAAPRRYYPEREQTVRSAYLEIKVPLISARNALPWARELELQLAARHDRYKIDAATTFVLETALNTIQYSQSSLSSTDPTVGLSFRPLEALMLRASYGTGFVPPAVQQLFPFGTTTSFAAGAYVDIRRGGTPTGPIVGQQGGNPNLQPEQSESWSAGFVFTPLALQGLRLSLDYLRIEKTDNIVGNFAPQLLIDNESLFPGRVTRAAVAPGDPYGVGVITNIDQTAVNLSRLNVHALDLALDYSWDTRWGSLELFAAATRTLRYETQVAPTTAFEDKVGLSARYPLKTKANAGVSWARNFWTLNWTTRYFDDYLVNDPALLSSAPSILRQGNGGRIAAQVFHDVSASFELDHSSLQSRRSSWLSGTQVQLGVKNVLNRKPEVDVLYSPTFYSMFADPRLASYWVNVRKSFN